MNTRRTRYADRTNHANRRPARRANRMRMTVVTQSGRQLYERTFGARK